MNLTANEGPVRVCLGSCFAVCFVIIGVILLGFRNGGNLEQKGINMEMQELMAGTDAVCFPGRFLEDTPRCKQEPFCTKYNKAGKKYCVEGGQQLVCYCSTQVKVTHPTLKNTAAWTTYTRAEVLIGPDRVNINRNQTQWCEMSLQASPWPNLITLSDFSHGSWSCGLDKESMRYQEGGRERKRGKCSIDPRYPPSYPCLEPLASEFPCVHLVSGGVYVGTKQQLVSQRKACGKDDEEKKQILSVFSIISFCTAACVCTWATLPLTRSAKSSISRSARDYARSAREPLPDHHASSGIDEEAGSAEPKHKQRTGHRGSHRSHEDRDHEHSEKRKKYREHRHEAAAQKNKRKEERRKQHRHKHRETAPPVPQQWMAAEEAIGPMPNDRLLEDEVFESQLDTQSIDDNDRLLQDSLALDTSAGLSCRLPPGFNRPPVIPELEPIFDMPIVEPPRVNVVSILPSAGIPDQYRTMLSRASLSFWGNRS